MSWRISSFLSLDRLRASSFKKPIFSMQLPLLSGGLRYQTHSYSPFQLSKIDDPADLQKPKKLTRREKIFKIISHYMPPIDLDSTALLWWNIIVIFLIAYNLIQTPIIILIVDNVYGDPFFSTDFYYYDIAVLIVFISDMLFVRWRVSFYQGQRKNTNNIDVFSRYWKEYFPFDLISTFGYFLFIVIGINAQIKLICYVRVFSMWNIDEEIRNKIEMKPITNGIYKFMRQIILIFFYLSLGACFYFAMDYSLYLQQGFFYENQLLWLTGSGATQDINLLETFPWYIWYEYSLYLIFQTSRGVGYGDITPMNPYEAFYIIVLILINLAIFSMYANGILLIVDEVSNKQIVRQHSILNRGFKVYQLSYKVKEKSRKYVQGRVQIGIEEQQHFLLSLLSEQLQDDFKLNFTRQFWDNLVIMHLIFEQEDHQWTFFAKELIPNMKQRYYSAGDQILHRNQSKNFILGLIARGRVKVSNSIVNYEKKYESLQYIGQNQFFFKNKVTKDHNCDIFTKICYFQKEDFFRIIRRHPLERQILAYHLDLVKINKHTGQNFQLSCCLCEKSHLQEFCPINEDWKSKIINFYSVAHVEESSPRSKYPRKSFLLHRQEGLFIKRQFMQSIQADKCHLYAHYYPNSNIDFLAKDS